MADPRGGGGAASKNLRVDDRAPDSGEIRDCLLGFCGIRETDADDCSAPDTVT